MGNLGHHEALRALCPIDWTDVPQHDLKTFLGDVFAAAQTVIDSIPSSSPPALPISSATTVTANGRARANTDSAVSSTLDIPTHRTSTSISQSKQLQLEWREAKVNARDNPLGVKVYKLASKDGKGAWFARRSVHHGLSFDSWKRGLDKEFIETMKVQGYPGSGSIRGIGADKRVEYHQVPGAGQIQVFQLSAQFPGPTSPRDFTTLLLTSHVPETTSNKGLQEPRQYMIVSKPCIHPDCPPRHGIIRGQYESVEIIREVPMESIAQRRSWSSTDLTAKDGVSTTLPNASSTSDKGHGNEPPTTIEWLMVTRSDPGGSVPRFMIEKGTPPGIVNDAGKFLDWVTFEASRDTSTSSSIATEYPSTQIVTRPGIRVDNTHTTGTDSKTPHNQVEAQHSTTDETYWNSGLFGIITGAFGAASSVVTGGLRRQFTGESEYGTASSSESRLPGEAEADSPESETSSIHSYISALEKAMSHHPDEAKSLESVLGQSESTSQGSTPQLKELRKLQERRKKLDEKAARMAERINNKRAGDKEKDAAALAKAREKHEKEIAKQEARYRRELKKLDEKREAEERKAEERAKKVIEREEKTKLGLELDKARTERDIALKQVELLKHQIGELQAQNTALVATLGRTGGLDGTIDTIPPRNHVRGGSSSSSAQQ